ncbi:MAG: hypothetical protein OQL09_10690 [Gammaproteobacteria bacterium]|nr:hypothetical protein [Gammaproteobacteria bacterium]
MRFRHLICLASLSVPIAVVHASENVELNSFLTIGAATSSFEPNAGETFDSIYLDSIDDRFTTSNDSRYGINFRTQTSERLSGAAQLVGAGRNDNFDVEVEWAYVAYDFTDSINMRVGKLNLQTFLLSDYIDVGYLYPWVRPPEEVYNFVPFRNFPGFEMMHTARFGKSTLTSQIFTGSGYNSIDPSTSLPNGGNFVGESGIGVNFQLDTPYVTLRTGYITPVIKLTAANDAIIQDEGDRAKMFTLGISWDWNGFIGYSEYIDSQVEGTTKGFSPDQTGYYLTLGYQIGNFLPHVTVAGTDGEALNASTAQPVIQDSIAFGIRYDMNDSMALKFEVKQIEPETASSSFNSVDLATGEDTFMITSLALDVIF